MRLGNSKVADDTSSNETIILTLLTGTNKMREVILTFLCQTKPIKVSRTWIFEIFHFEINENYKVSIIKYIITVDGDYFYKKIIYTRFDG